MKLSPAATVATDKYIRNPLREQLIRDGSGIQPVLLIIIRKDRDKLIILSFPAIIFRNIHTFPISRISGSGVE